MSYFKCPDCGKEHHIFGDSHVDELSVKFGIDTVSKMPIDPGIAKACDEGKIEEYDNDYLEEIIEKIKRI